jgi:hypothetical protein
MALVRLHLRAALGAKALLLLAVLQAPGNIWMVSSGGVSGSLSGGHKRHMAQQEKHLLMPHCHHPLLCHTRVSQLLT